MLITKCICAGTTSCACLWEAGGARQTALRHITYFWIMTRFLGSRGSSWKGTAQDACPVYHALRTCVISHVYIRYASQQICCSYIFALLLNNTCKGRSCTPLELQQNRIQDSTQEDLIERVQRKNADPTIDVQCSCFAATTRAQSTDRRSRTCTTLAGSSSSGL